MFIGLFRVNLLIHVHKDKMARKILFPLSIIMIILLYSCESVPVKEDDNISLTPIKTPEITLTRAVI